MRLQLVLALLAGAETGSGEQHTDPAALQAQQKDVLLKFKASLIPKTTATLRSWDADNGDPCGDKSGGKGPWWGVGCDHPAKGDGVPVVEVISLNFEDFAGYLSPELPKLQHLKRLYLRGNPISGTVPASWDSFIRLEKLDIALMKLNNNTLPPGLTEHIAGHRAQDNTWSFAHDVDVDCVGAWSTCGRDCYRRYSITVEREGRGSSCPEEDKKSERCEPGEGKCPQLPPLDGKQHFSEAKNLLLGKEL